MKLTTSTCATFQKAIIKPAETTEAPVASIKSIIKPKAIGKKKGAGRKPI
jgi:hypothetical protein